MLFGHSRDYIRRQIKSAQSTLRKSTSRSQSDHTSGSGSTTRPRTSSTRTTDKENTRSQGLEAELRHKPNATHTTEKDEEDDDEEGDYGDDRDNSDDKNNEDDDEDSPVHGRIRRVSEKQAQRIDEQKQAEARKQKLASRSSQAEARKQMKAEKAAKAAERAAGRVEEEPLRPREDATFTLHTITGTRPTATKKNLVQRDNRVPLAPKFPSPDWRAQDSIDHRDSYHSNREALPSSQEEQQHTFRGRSPRREVPVARAPIRNINGGVVPDRVTIHVAAAHQSRTTRRSPSRSRSPDIGDKRRRSTSIDSEDLHELQTPRIATSSSRPRARDLDDRTKEYTMLAIKLYRCKLAAGDMFPESVGEGEYAKSAWDAACREFNEQLPLTPYVVKLITNRGPHMRGELKTKLRPMTELLYGFKTGNNRKTIAFNRKLAEDLKEGASFAFKYIKEQKGLYKAPILQRGANAMWFANRRDEGPSYPEYFSPFPYQGLAAILTATENTIDEWLNGIRTDVPFTANEYRSVYQTHLKSLQDYETHTAKYGLLGKILTRMHNIGHFHAGAQPITVAPTSVFSKEVLDAALKEWEEDEETETEGEEGEHDFE